MDPCESVVREHLEIESILWIREDLVLSDCVIFLREVCSPIQNEFTVNEREENVVKQHN